MKTFIVNFNISTIDFSEVAEVPANSIGNYIHVGSQQELENELDKWLISYDANCYSADYNSGIATLWFD